VLLHVERHSGLQFQPVLWPLQVREHEGRLLHHVHQRRREVLRDASIVLRLPRMLLQERLLLLRLLREYVLLLWDVRGVILGLKSRCGLPGRTWNRKITVGCGKGSARQAEPTITSMVVL
jgi:hypothetical protein